MSAADDPLLGRVIAGKFRVDRTLGQGGMGRVYQAEQTNLGKAIAIKVLHTNMAGDAMLEKRFYREAKSASQLSHPNIVQVIDFGDEGGLLYIAMELLAGRDLGKVLKQEFPFAPERIAHIVGQVLGALEEAHEKGIVHRDLKPENVMLLDVHGEDFVKVCDFGIAKATAEREAEGSAITSAGIICGTPEYMSPEQARGEALDGRSDLYSVASILYQMACGELPFRAETALGVVSKLLTDAPVPPSQRRPGVTVPAALEAVILRGLEKDRDKRFANATAMRDALYQAAGMKRPGGSGQMRKPAVAGHDPDVALAATGVATPASQPTLEPPSNTTMPVKRSRSVLIGGLIAVAAAAAVGVFLVAGPRGSSPAPTTPLVVVTPPSTPPAPEPPKAEPPKTEPPKTEPPKTEPPKTEPPKAETPKAEPPKAEAEKHADKKHHTAAPKATPSTPSTPTPVVKAPEPAAALSPFAEAEALFKAGNTDGALAKYLDAAKREPNDARTQRQIGKCYNRLGQRDRAQPYFWRYLELAPDAADAAFIRAMLQ